jgi:NADH:ubiquinone oxidoreductase subunit E
MTSKKGRRKTSKKSNSPIGAALVYGAGITGVQAALDLANAGIKVYLVDQDPSIGGKMARLDKTFPTNDCAMCTLAPKMVDAGGEINIEKMSYAEMVGVEGGPGHFRVKIRNKARSIDLDKCTGCEECIQNCPVTYKHYPPSEDIMRPQLAPEDQEKVETILHQYQHKKAPLMSVLQGVNAEFNYLPEDSLHYVSDQLGIPLAHILRVATFYTLFSLKPRGKTIISVCQGTSCFVRGAERIMERFQDTLGIEAGDVTPDRQFSLESVRCIGCCALAPVVKIGDGVHAKVRTKEVSEIIQRV